MSSVVSSPFRAAAPLSTPPKIAAPAFKPVALLPRQTTTGVLTGSGQASPFQWFKTLWNKFLSLLTPAEAAPAAAKSEETKPTPEAHHTHHAHGHDDEDCGNPDCPVHGSAHLD
jgi:hypothetical protein